MSSIQMVRLLSGEELLGDVEKLEDGSIIIREICQVATSYADPQQATAKIGIAPYLPYAETDKGISIKANYVGFIVKPVSELLNEYNKIFGSGIHIPDTSESEKFASKFMKG